MAEAKKTQNSVIQERIYSTVRSQIVKSELAGAANQWEHVDHSPKFENSVTTTRLTKLAANVKVKPVVK